MEESAASLASKSLQVSDSILESTVVNDMQNVINGGQGNELVNLLTKSYTGMPRKVAMLADWLILLDSNDQDIDDYISNNDIELNDKILSDHVENQIMNLTYDYILRRFTSQNGDRILKSFTSEPKWLDEMLEDSHWRQLIVNLYNKHENSALLRYCVRKIAEKGHCREIAGAINESIYFDVFYSVLQACLDELLCPLSSKSNLNKKNACIHRLASLIDDICHLCAAAEHMYIVGITILDNLYNIFSKELYKLTNSSNDNDDNDSSSSKNKRTILGLKALVKLLHRLRQEVQMTTARGTQGIEKLSTLTDTNNALIGTSHSDKSSSSSSGRTGRSDIGNRTGAGSGSRVRSAVCNGKGLKPLFPLTNISYNNNEDKDEDKDEDEKKQNWWLLSSDVHFCTPHVDQLESFSLDRRRALVYQVGGIKNKRINDNDSNDNNSSSMCEQWTKQNQDSLQKEVHDLIKTGRATSLHIQRIYDTLWVSSSVTTTGKGNMDFLETITSASLKRLFSITSMLYTPRVMLILQDALVHPEAAITDSTTHIASIISIISCVLYIKDINNISSCDLRASVEKLTIELVNAGEMMNSLSDSVASVVSSEAAHSMIDTLMKSGYILKENANDNSYRCGVVASCILRWLTSCLAIGEARRTPPRGLLSEPSLLLELTVLTAENFPSLHPECYHLLRPLMHLKVSESLDRDTLSRLHYDTLECLVYLMGLGFVTSPLAYLVSIVDTLDAALVRFLVLTIVSSVTGPYSKTFLELICALLARILRRDVLNERFQEFQKLGSLVRKIEHKIPKIAQSLNFSSLVKRNAILLQAVNANMSMNVDAVSMHVETPDTTTNNNGDDDEDIFGDDDSGDDLP